jgi:cytochrome c oxidase assembly protein subunit 15
VGITAIVAWARRPAVLGRLALVSVVANVVIVVTGGAVRLTGSGLGCPTWPSCTDRSLVPTKAYAVHGVIEFANRQLTIVLVLIALATWGAAMLQRRERLLASVVLAGIPAQAVLGGLTVVTGLNPWLVAAHFMVSMAILGVTVVLWSRLRRSGAVGTVPRPAAYLARLVVVITAAVLTIGTVVTGSGPHAGSKGATHRTGLDPAAISQLHADAVMVLLGTTIGLVVVFAALRLAPSAQRAARLLLAAEVGQGAIGYAQYFTHVPPLLVGVHMLGACLVWIAALRTVLHVTADAVSTTWAGTARPGDNSLIGAG